MNKKLLLYDADSLAYKHSENDTLEEAIQKVDGIIQNVLDFSKCDAYCLFLSEGRYFRHDLTLDKSTSKTSYKAKRGISKQPWIKAIKEYLKAQYGAMSYKFVEADDSVIYWNNQPMNIHLIENISIDIDIETIIASEDKDVLYNTVGKHINPNKKNPITGNWETIWVETNKEDADYHRFSQMIVGDTSDGVEGLKGKGIKYFEKIFKDRLQPINYPAIMLSCYIDHHGESNGVFEFQKNYRLLSMLKTDEDWLREVGYIPELPKINYINKVNEPEINF